MNSFYSEPSILTLVFLVGIAVGALFNSLYRAAKIRRLKHQFIREVLADMEKSVPGRKPFTAAPLHWNKQTSDTASAVVSAGKQADSVLQQDQTGEVTHGPVVGDSTI